MLELVLTLHLFDFSLHATAGEEPREPGDGNGGDKKTRADEPPGFPEERRDRERQRGALRVPNPIVVAGDHAKTVRAGGKPAVERGALGTGVDPIAVDALQTILEKNLVWRDEAQAAVAKLETSVIGTQPIR